MEKTSIAELEKRFDEDYLQRLRSLRLMDDDFMTNVFEGHFECVELVLRIIMNQDDLIVVDAHTQVFVENLKKRSVRFDILAVDSLNRKYNIEIQRADA